VKFQSISKYHTDLLNGTYTCLSTVQHFLFEIQSKAHLNAFVEVYTEEALQRAAFLDSERSKTGITGKLHGVIVAIKDVICYKDYTITASSKILSGFTSIYNATAVIKLLR